jgi:hypothetical protein
MRCTSVSLRNKWTTLLGKLLRRISTSLHFVLHRWPTRPGSPGLGSAERAEKEADIACDAHSLPLATPHALINCWITSLKAPVLLPGNSQFYGNIYAACT